MPSWNDILNEINTAENPIDTIRRSYLRCLSDLTGRNTIAYYSGFLVKPNNTPNIDINDNDMPGFMNVLHGLDCTKGLDLILHTPGGIPVAAEAIVKYLRSKFGKNIRVFVPQIAMSAGTMVACAGKEIAMGKHSSLGPIDPQFSGIPAYNIKREFEDARDDLVINPQNERYWALRLQKYPAAFLKTAIDAIELSDNLLEDWLGTCMFDKNNADDSVKIKRIVRTLNEHDESKAHGRHFDIEFCKNLGLKILELESDNELQDAVLSVHHAYIHTLSASPAVKIIENQNGIASINNFTN